jgi:integrase
MLGMVDRGNPVGQRDYAILLLVAKLGIRVGDVKALKLADLDWHNQEIRFFQEKTGNAVTYPILKDIGWAIIQYLKEGRPKESTSPYLFIRMHAPFEEFGENANLYNMITKYTRLAGIKVPKGRRRGLHSLRHTLAGALLEQGTPLPIISDILGHANPKSTAVYLRTSFENLKVCALDPEEVLPND